MQVTLDLSFLTSAWFAALVVPAVAAFALAALLLAGFSLAERRFASLPTGLGRRIAAGALAVGFLTGYGMLHGMPDMPPGTAAEKLTVLSLAGLLAGLALDALRLPAPLVQAVALGWAEVAVLWIAWPRIDAGTGAALVLTLLLVLATALAAWRIAAANASGLTPLLLLAGMALGLAAVANAGGASPFAVLAAMLGSAALGTALLGWPLPRLRCEGAVLVPGLALLAGFAAAIAHYGPGRPAPLLLLLPALFAARLLDRLRMSPQHGGTARDNALGPLVLLIIMAVPAMLAMLAAYALAPLAAGEGGIG